MSKMFKGFKEVVLKYKYYFIIFIVLSLLLCGLDQLTKWLAVINLGPLKNGSYNTDLPNQYGNSIEIIPNLLNFTLLTNNGAAFGMGSGTYYMRVIFIIISWVVFIGLPFVCLYVLNKNKTEKISMTYFIACLLIYGGNLGNLIDRTFYWDNPCGVIDFIDISPLIPGFGIFNLADAFVVIGVLIIFVILIIDLFKKDNSKEKQTINNIKESSVKHSDDLNNNNEK